MSDQIKTCEIGGTCGKNGKKRITYNALDVGEGES
jgi:hypothetical protein